MTSKSVLITGCSAGGIGSALAEAFQKHDLQVFATARTPSKMAHLEQLSNVTLLTLDVTDPLTITAAFEAVKVQTGGKLDYLVNAHGGFMVMPVLDINLNDLKALFDSNVFGALATMQAFAPLLVAAKGTIINIGSMSGYFHAPWMSPYGASKGCLSMFSETLRLELEPLGVKVVTVESGSVKTNIMKFGSDFKLPPTSLYKSVESKIAWYARGDNIQDKMSAEDYANRVVGDVLGGAKGKIWRGKLATTLKYLTSMPSSLMESGMMKAAGLDKFEISPKQ